MTEPGSRPPADDIRTVLNRLDGARIPGGCDACDAYQTITSAGLLTEIRVHHDDWCPAYRRIAARRTS